jgi:hypothetical protein
VGIEQVALGAWGCTIRFETVQLVETGAMPLQLGVKRLVEEAVAAGGLRACCAGGIAVHIQVPKSAAGGGR